MDASKAGLYRFIPKFPGEYQDVAHDEQGRIECRLYRPHWQVAFIEVADWKGYSRTFPVPSEPLEAVDGR